MPTSAPPPNQPQPWHTIRVKRNGVTRLVKVRITPKRKRSGGNG